MQNDRFSVSNEHQPYEQTGETGAQFRIFGVLFLALLIGIAVVTDVGIIRYRTTGKPDLSYWTDMGGDDFENQYTACMPGKLGFLDLNGGIARLLGNRRLNRIVRMDNGDLTEPAVHFDETLLRQEADRIAELQNTLSAQGIPFLYLVAAEKTDPEDPEIPVGYQDYTNANMDVFVDELARQKVNFLDLRKVLHESGKDYYSCFYHTDHHWTTETGFFVYTRIMEWLGTHCGISYDPGVTDISNYEIHTYPDVFLGSRGKRVGTLYGGVDDFDVIVPEFSSRLTDLETGEQGDFGTLLVHEDYVQNHPDYLKSDIYDLTLQSASHTLNEDADNNADVIFVSDSYGFSVQPYLSLALHRLDVAGAYESQSLHTMVDAVQPQAVVLLHCTSFHFGKEESFDFGY